MTDFIHRNQSRGHVQQGWLNTYHSFSFASWYDPRYMGVSALRVINDDTIDAHNGFGTHGHDNMEILTYVLAGEITHKDSMGNHGGIKAGEWQLMSAGTGVHHSEINEGDVPVHLFQIWIYPNQQDLEPSYQQIACDPKDFPNQWSLIAAPQGKEAPLQIHQSASVRATWLEQGQQLPMQHQHGVTYLHVIEGEVHIDEHILKAGDAIGTVNNYEVKASQNAHLIWFDLPLKA